MRGLAFPTNLNNDGDTPADYGTPASQPDDIPIDPALGGPEVVPAVPLSLESNETQVLTELPHTVVGEYPHFIVSRGIVHGVDLYSQGPQGDPFAPQPANFVPIELPKSTPTLKPPKRKRKPRREEECGFCQGDDKKNKQGELETMVTCVECGRSGHPSCMELEEVADAIRCYPWKCNECKNCEICQEKGDDARILFCDFCDRGWHMDCLEPRIDDSPPGKWHCPRCPPISSTPDHQEVVGDEINSALENDLSNTRSVTSASRSQSASHQPFRSQSAAGLKRKAKGRQGRKPKERVVVSEESSEDEDEDEDEDDETPVPARRGKPKTTAARGSGKVLRTGSNPNLASPSKKRMRLHVNSSAISNTSLPRIRFRFGPQKGKGKEREEDDEPRKGLFDDILGSEDRDVSKTSIETGDKLRFERSRLLAEAKLAPPPPSSSILETPQTPMAGPSNRPLRSSTLQHVSSLPSLTMPLSAFSASPAPSTPGPYPFPSNSLRIRTIRFGQFDIQTWYDAPFPEEYANIPDGRLWICEFCLKYMKSGFGAGRHRMKCKARHPPGDEIYRDGVVSIFEVDGRKNKIYCQNLCLLSKMFLDHKSLFYDVEPFLFYVMTEVDDIGSRFVGYFSKEKRSPKDYNVSCIMTLPVRQRQGWGNLLIDFSYLLSKKEGRLGSPEKPLSGLGALGYKNYWTLAVMRFLKTAVPENMRFEDICQATSLTVEDVYTTLTQQAMLTLRETTPTPIRLTPGQSVKNPKGRRNGVARRHLQRTQTQDDLEVNKAPFEPPKHYTINWERDKVDKYIDSWEAKGYLRLKPEKLKWSPFLLTRSKQRENDGVSLGANGTNGGLVVAGEQLSGNASMVDELVIGEEENGTVDLLRRELSPELTSEVTEVRTKTIPVMFPAGTLQQKTALRLDEHGDKEDRREAPKEGLHANFGRDSREDDPSNSSPRLKNNQFDQQTLNFRSTRSRSAVTEERDFSQKKSRHASRSGSNVPNHGGDDFKESGLQDVLSAMEDPTPAQYMRASRASPVKRSTTSGSTPPPRKRRRVGTFAQTPTTEPSSQSPPLVSLPPSPEVEMNIESSSSLAEVTPTSPPRHYRKPSLLTNGGDFASLHARLNGQVLLPIEDELAVTVSGSQQPTIRHMERLTLSDQGLFPEEKNDQSHAEVKSEDLETPLITITSLASRQQRVPGDEGECNGNAYHFLNGHTKGEDRDTEHLQLNSGGHLGKRVARTVAASEGNGEEDMDAEGV